MKSYLKWVMPGVQAVMTVILLFMLVTSKLLPGKYLGIAVFAALVLLGITCLMALKWLIYVHCTLPHNFLSRV